MICKKCRSALPDGTELCPVCGTPLVNVGYAGYQQPDPFAAYDDPAAQPPQEEQAEYDEDGGYTAEPIEPAYEPAPAQRQRRSSYREDEPEQQEPESEYEEKPNFKDPPEKFKPYVVPPEEPSELIEAVSSFPAFLRAIVFEPKTTLNTMLDRADTWSGILLAVAALMMGLFAAIGLGTGAMRVHPASERGLGYALYVFLSNFGVGSVVGAGLMLTLLEIIGALVYLAVYAHVPLSLPLATTTAAYALMPKLVMSLPILLTSMFSPLLGYALTMGEVVWSLLSLKLVMLETPMREDDTAHWRTSLILLLIPALTILLAAAFGG